MIKRDAALPNKARCGFTQKARCGFTQKSITPVAIMLHVKMVKICTLKAELQYHNHACIDGIVSHFQRACLAYYKQDKLFQNASRCGKW